MVHCVPAEPDFAASAERVVWQALKRKLRADDALLANVRLTDERGDHELDLVVGLAGAGVAVIEVKGGSVTHDGHGRVQTGATVRQVDPVRQAREGSTRCAPTWIGIRVGAGAGSGSRTWSRSPTPGSSLSSRYPIARAGW